FDNSGGQINEFDSSEVQLTNGASVHGGAFFGLGTGIVRVLDTAVVADLTLATDFIANNGSTTTFSGSIVNNGTIDLHSTGSFTDLKLNGDVTLSGFGTLYLTNADR